MDEKERAELQSRVWGIRAPIAELEAIKDRMIQYWETQKSGGGGWRKWFGKGKAGLAPGTVELWSADVKELYYHFVAAWEMLKAFSEGEEKYLASSRLFLGRTPSLFGQCRSELADRPDPTARALADDLQRAYDQCREAFAAELSPLETAPTPPAVIVPVIKVSEKEYHLPCRVCGEIAVIFKEGVSQWSHKTGLIFSGITCSYNLGPKPVAKVFGWLKKDQIAKVHQFMIKEKLRDEGIDAFCPDCDKIYCRGHYRVEEEWDEGFYDDSWGTCPQGHRRLIDD